MDEGWLVENQPDEVNLSVELDVDGEGEYKNQEVELEKIGPSLSSGHGLKGLAGAVGVFDADLCDSKQEKSNLGS